MSAALRHLTRHLSRVRRPAVRATVTLLALAALATGSTPATPVSSAAGDGTQPLQPALAQQVHEAADPATGDTAPVPLPPPSPDATDSRPAAPAAEPSPAPVPPEVPLQQPDLLVTGLARDGLGQAAVTVDGVVHLAEASRTDVHLVTAPDTAFELTAFGIDPVQFRPLTPEVTAQSAGVWERLRDGEIVVRHDVAHELELELGGTVELQVGGVRRPVRVGAFASNGAPPVADLLVPRDLLREFGPLTPNTLVVAADDDSDPETVGAHIVETLGGGEVTLRHAPETRQAALAGAASDGIEPFTYTDLGDGMIAIDPAWIQRWIVTVDLPHLGRTKCHRVMVPQLLAVLDVIGQEDLAHLLKPEQFAGCWVPRHIGWNPRRPLSMHAWGLAVDINTQDNWIGETPTLHPRIVQIFERCGFEWGGRWSRPDGMHFELDRIVDPGACRG